MPSQAQLLMTDLRTVDAAALASMLPWLGQAERARHDRLVKHARRAQLLVGRVLLRVAAAELLGVAPASLVLCERPGLGPTLEAPHTLPGLSISHSGHWVAVAVSTDTPLGLDIETLDPARDIHALALQAFGDTQAAWLAQRPAAFRVRDFYGMWSELEARIKLNRAEGTCLQLQHPEVSIALCSTLALDAAPVPRLIALPV